MILGAFLFMDKIGSPSLFTAGVILTSAGLACIVTQYVPHNLPGEKQDDIR